MKHLSITYLFIIGIALMSSLTSCESDVFNAINGTSSGQELQIEGTICDFAFNNTNIGNQTVATGTTRSGAVDAVTAATGIRNNGYRTVFTPQSEIGVFAIDAEGNIIAECNNMHMALASDGKWKDVTFSKDGDKTVETLGDGRLVEIPGAKYVAYYPYNASYTGKTIQQIIDGFTPAEDQSSYYKYIRSDLLVSELTTPSNGILSFTFGHAMSLLTVYYNGTNDGDLTIEGPVAKSKMFRFSYDYSYGGSTDDSRLDGSGSTDASKLDPNSPMPYRYLVNPNTAKSQNIYGEGKTYHVYGTLALNSTTTKQFSRGISSFANGMCYYISLSGVPNPEFSYSEVGVDLGLPSGVKWARYNLGAESGHSDEYYIDNDGAHKLLSDTQGPKDALARNIACDRGDYYSWGEPYTKYYKVQPATSVTTRKVCGYGAGQYFDYPNFTIAPVDGDVAGTQYDVAHSTLWRGEWRFPTEDEVDELIRNCTITLEYIYFESNDRYMEDEIINGVSVSKGWDAASAPNSNRYTDIYKNNSLPGIIAGYGFANEAAYKATNIYQKHLFMIPVYKFTSKINGNSICFAGGTWTDWTIDQLRLSTSTGLHNQYAGMYYFTSNASHTNDANGATCCSYFEFRFDKNTQGMRKNIKTLIQGTTTTGLPFAYPEVGAANCDNFLSFSTRASDSKKLYGLTQEGHRYTGMLIRPVYGGKNWK